MKYETIDVVMSLIGPIDPVGSTQSDEKRLQNLAELCDLAGDILYRIQQVAKNTTRHEYSMKCAGEYAEKFLSQTSQSLIDSQQQR